MRSLLLATLLIAQAALRAQSIEEKKAQSIQKAVSESAQGVPNINREIAALRSALESCYERAGNLYYHHASEEEFSSLLSEVGRLKGEMTHLEERWREAAVLDAKVEEEGFALWDQEETTLGQLIMEYGAMDYLYVVPPDMAAFKLNMHSNIPIPRESWNEVLEIILAQNGIGVKKLNPYAKQLFILKQDPSSVRHIASSKEDLALIPPVTRVFFLLSPPVEQAKSVFQFLEKFSDVKQSFIYQIGAKIAIVSPKEEVERLLSLYNSVWEGHKGKISKVVPVTKMSVKEIRKYLIPRSLATFSKSLMSAPLRFPSRSPCRESNLCLREEPAPLPPLRP